MAAFIRWAATSAALTGLLAAAVVSRMVARLATAGGRLGQRWRGDWPNAGAATGLLLHAVRHSDGNGCLTAWVAVSAPPGWRLAHFEHALARRRPHGFGARGR